jgi:hypothetical protein
MYVGPDQFIPLSSFLGTVLGVVLIFWRRLALWAHKLSQSLFAKQVDSGDGQK